MEHLSQAEVHRSGGDWVWTECMYHCYNRHALDAQEGKSED